MNGIKTRSSQILIVLILLMIVLFIRLAVLTIIQNDYWIKASNNLSTKNIVTPAPRGEIETDTEDWWQAIWQVLTYR